MFIDTESNQNLSTKQILYDADIVVVNLSQDPKDIYDFFENYTSLKEKAVYIIGRYQPEKRWTRNRICYEYKIPRNKVGVIPYNVDFNDALENGKLQHFLNYNYTGPVRLENDYFMRQCKKSAGVVLNMISEVRKKKEKQKRQSYIDELCKSSMSEFGLLAEYAKEKNKFI